jgi:hypothetical protein
MEFDVGARRDRANRLVHKVLCLSAAVHVVVGCWLLVVGCWLLVVGCCCWLSVVVGGVLKKCMVMECQIDVQPVESVVQGRPWIRWCKVDRGFGGARSTVDSVVQGQPVRLKHTVHSSPYTVHILHFTFPMSLFCHRSHFPCHFFATVHIFTTVAVHRRGPSITRRREDPLSPGKTTRHPTAGGHHRAERARDRKGEVEQVGSERNAQTHAHTNTCGACNRARAHTCSRVGGEATLVATEKGTTTNRR